MSSVTSRPTEPLDGESLKLLSVLLQLVSMGKKAKRKGKKEKRLGREALIQRANRALGNEILVNTPAEALHFNAHASPNLTISLDNNPQAMVQHMKDTIFSMFENNMRELYEQNWDWDPEEKKAELFAPTSRMLLVHDDSDGELVAFTHFRFEPDDDGM